MTTLPRPSLRVPSALSLLALAALGEPVSAQVPEGHLVVSSFNYSGVPGNAGIYFVDPVAPHAVTAVTGLPLDLTGATPSAGANFVIRDPRTERLLCGNVVLNGGALSAWLLRLSGANVTGWSQVTLGTVSAFDGGVNGGAFLPNGDVLLAVNRITTGPTAYQPLLRWTPPNGTNGPNGTLTAVPLAPPYTTPGNICNAVIATEDGQTAIAALNRSPIYGSQLLFDVVAIPLSGGPPTVLGTLFTGEFVTQFAWACNGDLVAVTAGYPLGAGGRRITWANGPSGWTQTGSTSWSGINDFNAACIDPSSCVAYLSPNTTNTSTLAMLPSGAATPTAMPTIPLAVVSGIDVNPCPEVTEAATAGPSGFAARWAYRPFPGGQPLPGLTVGLHVQASAPGAITTGLLSLGRQAMTVLGLQIHVDVASLVPIGTQVGTATPAFALPIPNVPQFLGLEIFGQAVSFDPLSGDLASTELLSLTIGC